ncbi:PREDICTED: NAC transcription factor 29-like [Camelina sativa]|uniref:NAC transcription factor 29-like n=1 Tax=Camelina sativa TaxID=90675 RepID=A0ABM1RBV3_CAMSA|nr:PREDICTED: NAC transcription factor 29-like [Camelina sativa]
MEIACWKKETCVLWSCEWGGKMKSSIASSSSSSSAAHNLPYVLPPGFKFTPSDEELFINYLKPFSPDRKYYYPPFNIPIHHVNIYKSNPYQLSVEFEKGNDEEWFFVTERNKIGKNGKKQNRGDDSGGYWNATVGAKQIYAGQDDVGYVTALEYCVGRPPNGVKTDWLMHEYWFESSSDDNDKVDYALCKIYLTPSAVKRMKAEKKEKLKKGKGVSKEEVKQLDLQHQQDQSQLQQPHDSLLPAQQHEPQPQPPVIPDDDNFDDFDELPEDFKDFLAQLMKPDSLDGDEQPDDSDFLQGFITDGME